MSNERCRCNPAITDARQRRDELRLTHEAATEELTVCRARLRAAEAKRASDATAYQAALDATRAQRDRVVTLVDQIRVAEARLTLAEAATDAPNGGQIPGSQQYQTASVAAGPGGAR